MVPTSQSDPAGVKVRVSTAENPRQVPRSLQRALGRCGTSFHGEVMAERLARAKALLRSGDLKLSDIGARVGISERALGLLFRARTGLAPAEWRKRDRG